MKLLYVLLCCYFINIVSAIDYKYKDGQCPQQIECNYDQRKCEMNDLSHDNWNRVWDSVKVTNFKIPPGVWTLDFNYATRYQGVAQISITCWYTLPGSSEWVYNLGFAGDVVQVKDNGWKSHITIYGDMICYNYEDGKQNPCVFYFGVD